MPNLTEKYPSLRMNSIYDWLPRFHLLLCPNARSIFVPCIHTGNISIFRKHTIIKKNKLNMTTEISRSHNLGDLACTPLSSVRDSSGLSNQKASFCCSLLIIQYGMRPGNISEGSRPCQWCKYYPEQERKALRNK
jgi:hypothetical protein